MKKSLLAIATLLGLALMGCNSDDNNAPPVTDTKPTISNGDLDTISKAFNADAQQVKAVCTDDRFVCGVSDDVAFIELHNFVSLQKNTNTEQVSLEQNVKFYTLPYNYDTEFMPNQPLRLDSRFGFKCDGCGNDLEIESLHKDPISGEWFHTTSYDYTFSAFEENHYLIANNKIDLKKNDYMSFFSYLSGDRGVVLHDVQWQLSIAGKSYNERQKEWLTSYIYNSVHDLNNEEAQYFFKLLMDENQKQFEGN